MNFAPGHSPSLPAARAAAEQRGHRLGCDRLTLLMATKMNTEIYREPGRFAGWPANCMPTPRRHLSSAAALTGWLGLFWVKSHPRCGGVLPTYCGCPDTDCRADGMWGFGEEVVCCYTVGSYEAPSEHASMHAVDKTKPFETRQSRSLDGGATWAESVLMPAESGGRGVSADEHMQTGSGLRCDEAIADGTLVLQECSGDVPFSHPQFCMMLAKTGLSEGCKSFFYWSIDKCHSWQGPFAIPMLDRTGIAARTDYIVLGPQSCLLMLTANKANGSEGHVMAVKTVDGGKSWRLAVRKTPSFCAFQICKTPICQDRLGTKRKK
jgi:hypothetical protein